MTTGIVEPHCDHSAVEQIARALYDHGLQVVRAGDAPFFYGRKALTTKLVNEVNENPFVAVVGASDSGKSSVVRAGLYRTCVPTPAARPGRWRP